MKRCDHCNTKTNPDSAHFCKGCGHRLGSGNWVVFDFQSKVAVDTHELDNLKKLNQHLTTENKQLKLENSRLSASAAGNSTAATAQFRLPNAYLIVKADDSLSALGVGPSGRFLFANKRSLGIDPAPAAQVIRGMMEAPVRFVVELREGRLLVANLATPMLVNGYGLTGTTTLHNGDVITFQAVANLEIVVSTPQRNK